MDRGCFTEKNLIALRICLSGVHMARTICIKLDQDLDKMLVEISRKENKSISDVVRDAIKIYHEYVYERILFIHINEEYSGKTDLIPYAIFLKYFYEHRDEIEKQLQMLQKLLSQGISLDRAIRMVVEEVRKGKIR